MAQAKNKTPEEQIAELTTQNAELVAQNKAQAEIIKELNETVEAKDAEVAKAIKKPVFKVNKKSYVLQFAKFTHKVDGKPVEITEEVLRESPELVKELIELKSGALQEMGGK